VCSQAALAFANSSHADEWHARRQLHAAKVGRAVPDLTVIGNMSADSAK
jgi:hypothetical protein